MTISPEVEAAIFNIRLQFENNPYVELSTKSYLHTIINAAAQPLLIRDDELIKKIEEILEMAKNPPYLVNATQPCGCNPSGLSGSINSCEQLRNKMKRVV